MILPRRATTAAWVLLGMFLSAQTPAAQQATVAASAGLSDALEGTTRLVTPAIVQILTTSALAW